ncbi:pyridoxal 5'-phosphate synthase glutaminase subunit PdxT [Desmospora activa]|uniref:Pyridoxal 5'-phosphate synthase subunit PdxT n=1 Tax=Desmospora activa DSM 45169 TaxID=1121389 RepID=A0A2T4Z4Z1_9BACL|nr:pyridoxal 5'-phosphate synthase glutaminase subunit PdxT [Desmospora activa]PTM56925.1 pyridoxal phosphate synthase yaaE subunit [Desmospora activa DSM 45169]
MKIGVLALQGAVREHLSILESVGVDPVPVKQPQDLDCLDGLVIPGGESTTISKLMHRYGLMEPIRQRGLAGMPIFGTCAGLILLAKELEGTDQSHLGLLDITVRRNAFGRQRESFEAHLQVKGVADNYEAVFIRAPLIIKTGPAVKVLSALDERIVIVQEGHLLGAAFHPELTEDSRLHRHFVEMVKQAASVNA